MNSGKHIFAAVGRARDRKIKPAVKQQYRHIVAPAVTPDHLDDSRTPMNTTNPNKVT